MNILLFNNSVIPSLKYGGTERVIWYLGKELAKMGHKVSYLVAPGSSCDFARVIFYNPSVSLDSQIPEDTDIVHFNNIPSEEIKKPFVVTIHGNCNDFREFDINTIFVSKDHANRFDSGSYVYNGLDWDDYGKVEFGNQRKYFHFLANAAWRVKNVAGAIDIVKATKREKLYVLGGSRLNIKMGFRLTLSPRIKFFGMIGGEKKLNLLRNSKGLILPVKWSEPFGLAITESLYFGCPVFGTPYGSFPELINPEVGFLSNKCADHVSEILNADKYSRKKCHDYALENFNSKKMAESYLEKYTSVLNGKTLNKTKPKLKVLQDRKFLEWN